MVLSDRSRVRPVVVAALFLLAATWACQLPVRPASTQDRRLAAAERAFQEGRFADAVPLYESFLAQGQNDPREPYAQLRLGETFLRLNDLGAAQRTLHALRTRFPGSEEAAHAGILVAEAAFRRGNQAQALALLREVIGKSRSSEVTAQAYLLRGKIFLQRGDASLALSQFKKGLLALGDGVEKLGFYRGIVETLSEQTPNETLQRMANAGRTAFPADVSLFVLGQRAWRSGDTVTAARIFEQFAQRFPGHPLLGDIQEYRRQGADLLSLAAVHIGCILPLSGPLMDVGNEVRQGVQLSVDRFNAGFGEQKVRLLVRDSRSDPQSARDHMEALARDPGVIAVVGPVTSRAVVEASAVAETYGLPLISPTATAEWIDQLGEYVFRNAMTSGSQARSIANFALREMNLRSFAVLYPDDHYGTELADIFAEEIGARGGDILCRIPYPRGSADYGEQIRAIIDADLQRDPARHAALQSNTGAHESTRVLKDYHPGFDALYLPGYAEDVGLIAPQLAYYNAYPVQLLGSHKWESLELTRRGEQYVDGGIFTAGFFAASPHTDIAEFVAAYRRLYGDNPTLFSAQAYDAVEMILQVLVRGGRSRSEMQRGLLAMAHFPGVSGLTRMLPTGKMVKELFLIQIEQGFFKQIN